MTAVISESVDDDRVAILGGGRFAQAVAAILIGGGAKVRLWARRENARAHIAEAFPAIDVCDDLPRAVRGAGLIVVAVPALALPVLARALGPVVRGDQVLVHACRGVVEDQVLSFPHQVFRRYTCLKKVGVIGGPLYVEDIGSGRPVVAVIGARYDEVAARIARSIRVDRVKLHRTRDLIGVEVAGAMSNVSALAVGMADALELGDTVRGVLLTHGLSEATRVGLHLGAEGATFSGIAGVGDLIPRHVTSTRRNERVGGLVAVGHTVEQAIAQIEGEPEGVVTARQLARFGEREALQLPLVQAVAAVLAGTKSPRRALDDVLARDLVLGAELVRG